VELAWARETNPADDYEIHQIGGYQGFSGEIDEASDSLESNPGNNIASNNSPPESPSTSLSFTIPRPNDQGLFVINGSKYYTPYQHLILRGRDLNDSKPSYRRLDHVIEDAWTRRYIHNLNGTAFEFASKLAKHNRKKAASFLADFLCKLFRPSSSVGISYKLDSGMEQLLKPYDDRGNHYGLIAALTEVKSVRASCPKEIMKEVLDEHRDDHYHLLDSDPFFMKKEDRYSPDGICPCHTPDGSHLGLVNHLTSLSFISDERMINQQEGNLFGVIPDCIPFLGHNDPRRVLLGCAALTHAIEIDSAEPPIAMTEMDRRLSTIEWLDHKWLGVNLLVGFISWKGLNYEDAIVVSESASSKLSYTDKRVVSVPVPSFAFREGNSAVFRDGIREKGSVVRKGDKLVNLAYSIAHLDCQDRELDSESVGVCDVLPDIVEYHSSNLFSPCNGVIEEINHVQIWEESGANATIWRERVDFTIRTDRPLMLGDKICNRHGNKGIISAIIPDDNMPSVNGTPLEVLLSPIGVINRGNYGQLAEAIYTYMKSGYTEASFTLEDNLTRSLLNPGSSLHVTSVQQRIDDNTTQETSSIVGFNYFLRQPHNSSDKLKINTSLRQSENDDSSINDKPVKYGQMEIWALQAHGKQRVLDCVLSRKIHESTLSWLKTVGYQLVIGDKDAFLIPIDLRYPPDSSVDLFDAVASLRNIRPGASQYTQRSKAKLIDVLQCLSSNSFYDRVGDVHVDLGLPVELDLDRKEANPFTIQYLPILPASQRQSYDFTDSHITRLYKEIIRIVWKRNQGEVNQDWSKKRLSSYVERLFHLLLEQLDSKNGPIRGSALSRRLRNSSSMVIVPSPEVQLDSALIPWDVIRRLFKEQLERELGEGLCDLEFRDAAKRKKDIDRVLCMQRVLLNRYPSLHKYSILSFIPLVRFDDQPVLGLPPFATSPFGADFDGDTMTMVAISDATALDEVDDLSLLANVQSDADGSIVPTLSKDFLLGLAEYCASGSKRLDEWLSNIGLPLIGPIQDHELKAKLSSLLRAAVGVRSEVKLELFHNLISAALEGLEFVSIHCCIGYPAQMRKMLNRMLSCGAVKSEKLLEDEGANSDTQLVQGVSLNALREMAHVRIGYMTSAKTSIGNFGGYLRRLYYNFKLDNSGIRASSDETIGALVAAQSITERATQLALSPKSGKAPLDFKEFDRLLSKCLNSSIELDECESEICRLVKLGVMERSKLEMHLNNLRTVLVDKIDEDSLLALLYSPKTTLRKRKTLQAELSDPRVHVFLGC